MRTEQEINDQIAKTMDEDGNDANPWPAMTYSQGVDQALRWVLGDEDTPPMEEED